MGSPVSEVDELWAAFDSIPEEEFIARIDALDLPAAESLFQRAGAQDSTGHSDLAIPLYRAALAEGLTGSHRRQAVIQLASSLRNLGELDESLRLLEAEASSGETELDVQLAAFTALTLADLGRERDGLALLLQRLAPTVDRYQRSIGSYGRLLVDPDDD